MMLVGDVADRTAILVDDLVDTANTVTRAAKLLKEEGAVTVYALITHGVLSGEAIERINSSAIDKIVVTNSLDQEKNQIKCPKLEVLEVGHVFAEVSKDVIALVVELTGSYRQYGECITEKALAFCLSMIDTQKVFAFLFIVGWNPTQPSIVPKLVWSLKFMLLEEYEFLVQDLSLLLS